MSLRRMVAFYKCQPVGADDYRHGVAEWSAVPILKYAC